MKKILIIILITSFFAQIIGVAPIYAQATKGLPLPVPPATTPFQPGDKVKIQINFEGATESVRNNADVALVMDRSGSMNFDFGGDSIGTPKLDAAKSALSTFVNNTQEVFDRVGLVSFSGSCLSGGVNGFGGCANVDSCADLTRCATLDFGVVNMTSSNKVSLDTAINSIVAVGATSIGSGLSVASSELLSIPPRSPGSFAGKYIVLAADGQQNTVPSPYQNGILQVALDNNIKIFTVGVGEDVRNETSLPMEAFGNDYCEGCPDLDGDGFTSGEEILKDIACQTDPDCSDPLNADHYFFADSQSVLEDVYVDIQDLILGDTGYIITELINTSIFGNSIDPSTVEVRDESCLLGGGNVVEPIWELVLNGNFITLVLPPIPEDEANCLTFEVRIRDDIEDILPIGVVCTTLPCDLPIDSIGSTVVPFSTLIPACSDVHDTQSAFTCFFAVSSSTQPIGQGLIRIEPAVPAWLQAKGGDVGAVGKIDMTRDLLGLPTSSLDKNADYLVTANNNTLENFLSARDWLVKSYSTDVQGLNTYDGFLEKYSRRGVTSICTVDTCNFLTEGSLASAASSSDSGILMYTPTGGDTVTITETINYSAPSAVVFVEGNLEIEKNVIITSGNVGLVFIVEGEIRIDPSTTRIDGFYISGGKFKSGVSVGPTPLPVTDVVFFSGFETGDISEWDNVDNEVTDVPSDGSVRSGEYVLKSSSFGSLRKNIDPTSTLYVRHAFQARFIPFESTIPPSGISVSGVRDTASDNRIDVKIDHNGLLTLDATDNGGGVVTGPTIDPDDPNKWYVIEAKYEYGEESEIELIVDGTSWGTAPGGDTSSTFNQLQVGEFWLDFFYYDDYLAAKGGFPGDGRILLQKTGVFGGFPTSGDPLQGGAWLNTIEVPADGLLSADYTGTLRSGSVNMNNFNDINPGDTINVVKITGVMKRGSGADTNHFLRMREGGVDLNSPFPLPLTTSYDTYELISTSKPSSGSWSKAALEATQAGFGLSGPQDLFTDALYIQADYKPLPGGGSCAACQLIINGAGISLGGFSLNRSLGRENLNTPAEKFIYEPRYLWQLKDILGISVETFRELNP